MTGNGERPSSGSRGLPRSPRSPSLCKSCATATLSWLEPQDQRLYKPVSLHTAPAISIRVLTGLANLNMDYPRTPRDSLFEESAFTSVATPRTGHCRCLAAESSAGSSPWPHEAWELYLSFAMKDRLSPGKGASAFPPPLPTSPARPVWGAPESSFWTSSSRNSTPETPPAHLDFARSRWAADSPSLPTSPRPPLSPGIREQTHPEWLREWLRSLRLHKYYKCLVGIDREQLFELDGETMEKIGIDTVGARTKLSKVGSLPFIPPSPAPSHHQTANTRGP